MTFLRKHLNRDSPRVACAGNVCVDVYLDGLKSWPTGGERAIITSSTRTVGGNAMNVATVLSRMGVGSHLVALFAGDPNGSLVVEQLRRYDISHDPEFCRIQADETNTTARAFISVDPGGEPSFVYMPGVSVSLDAALLGRWLDAYGGEIDLLHLSAIGLLPGLEGEKLGRVLKDARAQHSELRISLDVTLVTGRTANEWRAALQPVLPHVDYLLPNLQEAQQILGESHTAGPKASIVAAATAAGRCLRSICGEQTTVVITLGEIGCLVLDSDGRDELLPVEPVQAVDRTGAGDAWCAGFISGLVRSDFSNVMEAASLANRVARLSVASVGVHSFDAGEID